MTREFPLTIDRLLADLSPATDVHANRDLTDILNLLTVQVQLHDPGREHVLPVFYAWARLSGEARTLHEASESWACFWRKLRQCSEMQTAQLQRMLRHDASRQHQLLGPAGYVWLHTWWIPWVESWRHKPLARLVDRGVLCALVYGAGKAVIWLAHVGQGEAI